ncbi:hemolysin-III channel protein-like protein Izh2 [Xylariomycetidae sp. FL2044]|nr:hemolysin-III channel protein-like protein Izh2 [Xylariomycetidae sp. FL2044]
MSESSIADGTNPTTTNANAHLRFRKEHGRGSMPLVSASASPSRGTRVEAVRLYAWRDLPEWQQEGNHFIEIGYRRATGSVRDCLHSWTYLHNETVNIFSHVIGALLFLVIPIYVFNTEIPPRYTVATVADKVVCSVYFIGVAICFVFSATFHTIMSHSANAFSLGMKLDFQGIILLMWGANIPLIYYGFICSRRLQIVYWCLTSVLALCCSVFTFQPRFSEPHLRPLRAATFGSLALSTLIPVVHALAAYGYAVQSRRMALQWVLATLIFNSLGAAAYALKFPEKWYPRRFDVFGASHQIMHIMVLFAGVAYVFGVLAAFDFLHDEGDQCR